MQKNVVPAFAAVTGATPTPTNDQPPAPSVDPFIRRPEVCRITSLPSSSLTDLISRGDFPRPFKLGERMSAWKLSEVREWMDSRTRSEAPGA